MAELPASKSVQLLVMRVTDERNSPELKVTWQDMPRRSTRRSTRWAIKGQLEIETGRSGKNPELKAPPP
jgi:hypothetical protein